MTYTLATIVTILSAEGNVETHYQTVQGGLGYKACQKALAALRIDAGENATILATCKGSN